MAMLSESECFDMSEVLYFALTRKLELGPSTHHFSVISYTIMTLETDNLKRVTTLTKKRNQEMGSNFNQ